MIKFSTKTNYAIVSQVQRIVLLALKLVNKPVTEVQVKRNGIHWKLNLSEVIDFMIFFVGGFDKTSGKAFGRALKPNDTILDIGANIGSFALVASKYIGNKGRIIAIEPSIYAYNKFQENLDLNRDLGSKITPVQAFVTQNDYPIPEGVYASWDTLQHKQRHKNHKGILTPTSGAISMSLDQIVKHFRIDQLDWLKIDVDGFEKDVLLGGQQVFINHKPNVFMELCEYSLTEHNTSVEEILSFLIQFDYEFYSVNGKAFKQDIQAIRKTIPRMGTINIFAYPKSK